MLLNCVSLTFYQTPEAQHANDQHVGAIIGEIRTKPSMGHRIDKHIDNPEQSLTKY